jgi:hypothetical protein
MRKQTAANNDILEAIKRRFNTKIYHKALEIMNTHGDATTLNYVQQFTTTDIRKSLFGTYE